MGAMFPKIALLAFVCLLPVASSHAAPVPEFAMSKIPVASSYLPFVGSDNTATLDGDAYQKQRDKLGSPMSILSHGEQREREMKNGYVTLFATWAQTTLRVPLGWYAVESNENVDESLVFSPGQTVKIVGRAAVENQKFQSDKNAFAQLKTASIEQTRVRLQKMGLTAGPIERIDLDDESFAVRVDKVTGKAGGKFSYIERFSQRSPKAERDEFWATMNSGKPMSPLQLPLGLSMLAPADKFEKYLPLFGLMARDEGLNWTRESWLPLDEFLAKTPDAARFIAVADEAVSLLKAGDVEGFNRRFPEAFEGNPKAEIARHLREVVTPFLNTLPAKVMRTNINVARNRDPIAPFFQVTLSRDFEIAKDNYPTYVIVMEKVGNDIKLTGIGTTDDPFTGV